MRGGAPTTGAGRAQSVGCVWVCSWLVRRGHMDVKDVCRLKWATLWARANSGTV